MDNFDLKHYLSNNKLNEEDKGAMYQLIKLRDIENPYNLHKDLISSLNRFARATVAKEQGYQGFGLDNELQLTRLDVNNQAAFHKLDREEVKDTLKKALELYRSALNEQDVKTKMTDFGPIDIPNTKKYLKRDITDVKRGDIIVHDETGKRYEVQDLIGKTHRLQSNKLRVIDTEGNVRVINPYKYSIQNESLNEDIQSELDKWEGRLYDLENMNKSSNNPDPIKQKKAIEGVKKKITSLKKKSEMNEIKGFEEFKETGFKLGDKVKFMGSAHPAHTKPIKLTGTIEYFEPSDEIGVRVDGYGAFIPFFEIQSNIELIKEE